MTKKDILKSVEEIRQKSYDSEQAHYLDDILRDSFIKFVAERKDSLGEKARLILMTNYFGIDRWYA